MIIQQIVAELQKLDKDISAVDIADTLWLAWQITKPTDGDQDIDGGERVTGGRHTSTSSGGTVRENFPVRRKRRLRTTKTSNIYPYDPGNESHQSAKQYGVPVELPTANALPNILKLTRALRPLNRRIPSRTTFFIDEQATAEQIADEGFLLPVWQPVLERWLDVVLVYDVAASMKIWRPTVIELYRLLAGLSAFRDVRLWEMVTDAPDGEVQLFAGLDGATEGHTPRSYQELTDPGGQRLILVISDCVSSAWHSGVMGRILSTWGHSTPVSLVQVLPIHFWRRTSLVHEIAIQMHAHQPGIPNSQLTVVSHETDLFDELELDQVTKIAVPVITLESWSLEAWVKMVTGKGGAYTAGYLFDTQRFETPSRKGTPVEALPDEQRVQRFRAIVSPLAFQLASLLSSAPVSLPIIYLIQQKLLPETWQTHIAEILLGGILKPSSAPGKYSIDVHQQQYEFVGNIRQHLRDTVPTATSADVIKLISNYIAQQRNAPQSFLATLPDPKATEGVSISSDMKILANATADVLRKRGFSQLADKLEADTTSPAEAPGSHTRESVQVVKSSSDDAELILVPAAMFNPDSSSEVDTDHLNDERFVEAFYIDKYPVTNRQFAQFVQATDYITVAEKQSKPETWQHPDGPESTIADDHPVVCVYREDALAYANWAGRRLPTRLEWERAMRGVAGLTWPWGNEWQDGVCNLQGSVTTPVDNYPDGVSPVECWDMVGNVWEWLADELDDGKLLLMGGSWAEQREAMPVGYKLRIAPGDGTDFDIGFRCALDASESFVEQDEIIDTPLTVSGLRRYVTELYQKLEQTARKNGYNSSEHLEVAHDLLSCLPVRIIPELAPLPRGSRMLFARNPMFQGREEELRNLAKTLKNNQSSVIRTVGLTGMGGVGKTQLASEFVHRYGQFFAGGVFWLSFADAANIPAEIAQCGGEGKLELRPDFHSLPLDEQVAAVQRAWAEEIPRLLVFDNVDGDDAEALVTQYRPATGGCRLLITSRRATWDVSLGIDTLPLGVHTRADSIALLQKFRPDLSESDADTIAAELGDLPLALHLAGSYLKQYTVDPATYLAQLRSERDSVPSNYQEQSLAQAFAVSYERLNPEDPVDALAMEILACASYFAPGEPIPDDLLRSIIELADFDWEGS
jgi:formylglycine-generating enzyme required for sulfatase activity